MKFHLYTISLLLILSTFSFEAYSQGSVIDSLKIDSLKKVLLAERDDTNKVNTLKSLSNIYDSVYDINNSLTYAKLMLALSQKISFKKGQGYAWLFISQFHYHKNDYKEAIRTASEALKIFREINLKQEIATCYSLIGINYTNWDNRYEATKNYYEALRLYEETGDKQSSADCLSWIAFNYLAQENYNASLDTYFKALKLLQETGSDKNFTAAFCNTYIAKIFLIQGRFSEASSYDSVGLKISLALKSKHMAANGYECLGNILAFRIPNNESSNISYAAILKEALKNYLESLNNFRDVPDSGGMGDEYKNIAEVNIRLNNFVEAQQYADSALLFAKIVHFKDNYEKSYLVQAKLDSATGNFKHAFESFKKYTAYRDSIINDEDAKKTTQVQMQYEFDKKDAIEKAAQNKKDAEAKRIKNQQYFAIAALGIIVLAVIIIALIQFKNNKQKQKANILLERQKQKVEITLAELKSTQAQLIQSEKMASLGELTAGIAHEIQNPLNFVNNFSDVNKELLEELKDEADKGNIEEVKMIANDVIGNEEKINHHGKRADAIVKGMLQHSRSSTGVKEPTDINALADEYLRLSYHGMRAKDKSFNAEIKADFDNSVGKINIVPQDIGGVLLNLYNNAFFALNEKSKMQNAKYEPTISVSTKKLNNSIELTVKDNGNGIPQKVVDKIFQPFFTTKPTGQGTGLGLSLSYDIIKAHGGEIKVESKEGDGSEFIIQLPTK